MCLTVKIYSYSERLLGVSTPQCCFHEGKGVLGLGHAVDEDACTLTRFLINQPESTMRGVCVATKALLVATRSHPHFKVMRPLVKILGLGSLGASSQPCCVATHRGQERQRGHPARPPGRLSQLRGREAICSRGNVEVQLLGPQVCTTWGRRSPC